MDDQRRDSSAEIVLNWNLYNGGTDQARVRQQVDLMNQAADLRDRVCRDTRQVGGHRLQRHAQADRATRLLERNTLAIEKARDAYRQQFDIGQRSLLDLLNAENEVYTARRAYANAEHDLALAYARTHAAMSRLGTTLGIARTDKTGRRGRRLDGRRRRAGSLPGAGRRRGDHRRGGTGTPRRPGDADRSGGPARPGAGSRHARPAGRRVVEPQGAPALSAVNRPPTWLDMTSAAAD